MTLTRRQFLAGTVALPLAGIALKQGRAHDWTEEDATAWSFCKRCGTTPMMVLEGKWPEICEEPCRYFVEWGPPSRVVLRDPSQMYFIGEDYWFTYA